MLYAKVVLGLPVEGPFDYSVPAPFQKNIKEGKRVWVEFRSQRKLGYVVKLSAKTGIRHVKPILEIIDNSPVLDKNMLLLTRKISDYYGCSWGEAIETALPDALRKGARIALGSAAQKYPGEKQSYKPELIHDLGRNARWDIYLGRIKEAVENNKSAIVLLPDIGSALKAKERISGELGLVPVILHRGQRKEAEEWLKLKASEFNVVVGTRSAIFAPVNNLGLVIIDEEQDTVYKQEQAPHYHARVAAFMRTEIEKAKLMLGSVSPSLESFYLAKRNKIKYTALPQPAGLPEVKIVDIHNEERYPRHGGGIILSKYLQDCIIQSLESKSKILLFLNRRGFATFASCRNCGEALRCPRCNINLVYYFKDNILNCRYCNFKMAPPRICPQCDSSYIKYLGAGTEKIESEVSRIFPYARISRIDNPEEMDIESADIFISTASITKRADYKFGLIGILSIDYSLNRVDFRSTEKTFSLLSGLLALTDKKIVIQTKLAKHYSLRAIETGDTGMFYEKELRQRKQLGFAPYRHLCLVKLRGRREESVKEATGILFQGLSKYARGDKHIDVVSLNPGQPAKLRGNFYWQVLIKSPSAQKIIRFLRLHLKNFRHSGIIMTVDMDPV